MANKKIVNKIKQNSDQILKMDDIQLFLELSKEFGELCARSKISTSQIRGIFQIVKQLPDDFESSKRNLNLLRPKLAYQKGRFKNLTPLTQILTHLIKKIDSDEGLKGFKEFFEAIIAYHKASGGD
jgi:CRISPR-associated protein Csm2